MAKSSRSSVRLSVSKTDAATPHTRKSRAVLSHHARVRRLLCLAVLLLAAQAYPQFSNPEFPDPGKPGMSREEQRKIGLQAAAQVYQQMPVLPDSSAETKYVRQLGEKLVATIPPEYSWPFEFHVVAQKEINAFALPGGPMFINTGLLKAVDNEAQLAAVMGHEMSHVILRHGTNQASKAKLIELPAMLAGQLAGNSMLGQLEQVGIGLGANSVLLKFSRSAESQADLMGSHIMAEAGYDPVEMAKFFDKLNSKGGAPPEFFSDHPNPDNRSKAIELEAERLPQQDYGYQTGQFQQMKKVVGTIKEPPPKRPSSQ